MGIKIINLPGISSPLNQEDHEPNIQLLINPNYEVRKHPHNKSIPTPLIFKNRPFGEPIEPMDTGQLHFTPAFDDESNESRSNDIPESDKCIVNVFMNHPAFNT